MNVFSTEGPPSGRQRQKLGSFRTPPLAQVVMAMIVFAGQSFAQTNQDSVAPDTLKKLTLEQLMDVDVTSVSRWAEKLSEAASAIQVVTGEDIHRSGATSLPEALRLAP